MYITCYCDRLAKFKKRLLVLLSACFAWFLNEIFICFNYLNIISVLKSNHCKNKYIKEEFVVPTRVF